MGDLGDGQPICDNFTVPDFANYIEVGVEPKRSSRMQSLLSVQNVNSLFHPHILGDPTLDG